MFDFRIARMGFCGYILVADPVNPEIQPTPQQLELYRILFSLAQDVGDKLTEEILTENRSMTPTQIGTEIHTRIKVESDRRSQAGLLPPSLQTEVSFADGNDAAYGEVGTKRTDAVLRDAQNNVVAIYDYKVGVVGFARVVSLTRANALRKAILNEKQARETVPVFSIPIELELKLRRR